MNSAASRICAAHSSVLVRRRGLAARMASRAAVTRAVGVITAVSFPVCLIGSSVLPDMPGDPRRPGLWCWGVGGQVMSRLLSSAVPTAGLRHATHARNHPPGPASAQRPQAEQATYAARRIRRPPTGLQARPGGRPTHRRLAGCLSTDKRASKKTPGPARPSQPARYGAARTAAARRTAGGSRTRTATQPAPPRTRRPPPAGQLHDSPKPAILHEPTNPAGLPFRHAVFDRGLASWHKEITLCDWPWAWVARTVPPICTLVPAGRLGPAT